MKYLIAIGIVLVIAAITNPDKAAHIDAVKQMFMGSVNEKMIDRISSGNSFEQAGATLGYTLGLSLIDKMAETIVQTKNFVIFSLTKVEFKGESKVIGIGAFGNVWIFVENNNSLLDN